MTLVSTAPLAQAAAPATPAPVPAAAPPQPAPKPGRSAQGLDLGDLVLALIGTGLGALAGYLSSTYIPRLPPQYQLVPAALSVEGSGAAVLAAVVCMLPFVNWISDNRATQKRLKLKRLLQKDKVFFMSVHDDVSILVAERGEQHVD